MAVHKSFLIYHQTRNDKSTKKIVKAGGNSPIKKMPKVQGFRLAFSYPNPIII
jgi:hypothetical protein